MALTMTGDCAWCYKDPCECGRKHGLGDNLRQAASDPTDCPDDVLSAKEIIEHHEALGCNFGDTTPVQVVQKGLLKAACGWHNGGTCNAILQYHGLIKRTGGKAAKLTKKGKAYLWEVYKDTIPGVS